MTQLALAYAGLKDIDEVAPLNDGDHECLADVREVLRRHGRLDRFGLTLLHSHFDIRDDEMLLESCDHDKRELFMRPVKLNSVTVENVVETQWRLTDGTTMVRCKVGCVQAPGSGHRKHHYRTQS